MVPGEHASGPLCSSKKINICLEHIKQIEVLSRNPFIANKIFHIIGGMEVKMAKAKGLIKDAELVLE